MSLSLADMLRVRIRAQQPLQFFGVRDLHFDHPALAVGIAVDECGILLEGLIRLENGPANRCVQLGDRFHRFDRSEDGFLRVARSALGQLHEHDVAQLALCVVGDPNLDDLRIAALPYPLVIGGKAKVFRYAGHGTGAYNRSARGASPAPSSSLNTILS